MTVIPEGGTAEPVDVSDKVTGFSFEDDEARVDRLQLAVDNHDLAAFDDPIWAKGNLVRFSFGFDGLMSPVREAVIKKTTGGRVLTVEAHGSAVVMDNVPKVRTFENATRSEIVRQVASENGWATNDVLFVEDTSERYEIVAQANYTDAQFLRKLAHLEGFEFFVDFDGFHWHPRRVGQTPILEFTYYTDPGRGDVIDFNVETNLTRLPGKVRLNGRDPRNKWSFSVEVDNETDRGRDATGKEVIVRDPVTAKLVNQTRAASEVNSADESESEAEAKAKARGRFRRAQQNAVKMTLVLRGEPRLLAKSVVRINGMGRRLSGNYYVRSVRHTLPGYRIEALVSSDGANASYGTDDESFASSAAVSAQVAALVDGAVHAPSTVDLAAVDGLVEVAERFAADCTRANAQATLSASRNVIGNASTVPAISGPTNELRALAARVLSATSVKAIAKLNSKETKKDGGGQDPLKPKITYDRVTGAEVTVYPDQGGREN